jgi:hypothetical protein
LRRENGVAATEKRAAIVFSSLAELSYISWLGYLLTTLAATFLVAFGYEKRISVLPVTLGKINWLYRESKRFVGFIADSARVTRSRDRIPPLRHQVVIVREVTSQCDEIVAFSLYFSESSSTTCSGELLSKFIGG